MTRFLILLILNLIYGMTTFAQDSIPKLDSGLPIDDDISYKGGQTRLMKIIEENLTYPKQAILDSISGTVIVYFTIDTNGHSTEIKVLRGVRKDIDSEAIRCVDNLNEWNLGTQNGEKIVMHHMLPIKFSFTDIKNKSKQ